MPLLYRFEGFMFYLSFLWLLFLKENNPPLSFPVFPYRLKYPRLFGFVFPCNWLPFSLCTFCLLLFN